MWVYPGLLLIVAAPYLFSGVLRGQYVFDDVKLVRENEAIRDLPAIHEIFAVTSTRWKDEEVRVNYRPVRFLSYALDYQLSRWFFASVDPDDPPVLFFHLTNVLLHLANTLLVLVIGRRLLGSGIAALMLALLFGLHPIQTEAVAYISGRRDVLSTFFFLAGLLAYLGRGDASPTASRSESAPDVSWFALATVPIFFAAGLLAKEMVVTFPAVLLLVDLLRRPRLTSRRVTLHLIVWAGALAFTYFKVSDPALVAEPLGGAMTSTILTAPRYVLHYLSLLLLPLSQTIDYSFNAIPISKEILTPWTTLPALVVGATLVILGLVALWRRQFLALGLLWFFGTLFPVLQFVPIAERFAERFLYLPGLGVFFLLATFFLRQDRRSPGVARAVAVAALLFCFGKSWARCTDWTTPYRLWKSATETQPECARAHLGYANALAQLGGDSTAKAVDEFSRSIEILEADPAGLVAEPLRKGHLLQARIFRAQALTALADVNPGNLLKAIDDYLWLLGQTDVDGTAVADSSRYLVIHHQLGLCYLGLGRQDEAVECFETLLEKATASGEIQPIHENFVRAAHYHIGVVHMHSGRAREAVESYGRSYAMIETSGSTSQRFNLVDEYADALIAIKEFDRAEGYLKAVIEEMGDDPDRKDLLYRMAMIFDRRGKPLEAIKQCEKCLELDAKFGPALLKLASIEENLGRLKRAEDLYNRVLELAPGHDQAQRGLQAVQIRRALAEQPADSRAQREQNSLLDGHLDRARQYYENGAFLAAPDLLNRVASTAPTPENASRRARAIRMLGDVARKIGNVSNAEKYYIAALEVSVAENDAILGLAELARARKKDLSEAETYYRQYLAQFSGNEFGDPSAYFQLAEILYTERLAEVAIDEIRSLYENARKAGYSDRVVDRRLGEVHAELGNWQKSFEILEAYLTYLDSKDAAGLTESHRKRENEKTREVLIERVLPNLIDD
jgi:tetratricopeptide (TPR) repeat protein